MLSNSALGLYQVCQGLSDIRIKTIFTVLPSESYYAIRLQMKELVGAGLIKKKRIQHDWKYELVARPSHPNLTHVGEGCDGAYRTRYSNTSTNLTSSKKLDSREVKSTVNLTQNHDLTIDHLLSKLPASNRLEIEFLLQGIKTYQKHLSKTDVKNVFEMFIKEQEHTIHYVCSKYNDKKYHGLYGIGYIKKILENCKKENKVITEVKNIKKKELEVFSSDLMKSKIESGLKIASHKLDDKSKLSIEAFLKLKDIKGLQKIYELGCEELKKQNRQSEIYKNYDWLK
jgi:DNA-binding protein Fis